VWGWMEFHVPWNSMFQPYGSSDHDKEVCRGHLLFQLCQSEALKFVNQTNSI